MQGLGPQPGRSNYLDFELEIGQGSGREYPVTLLRSPAGEAHATMHFPFDELALDLRLSKLQIALLRSGGKHRRAPSEEEQAVQDLGRSLFEALFGGRVRTCYDVSLRQAAEQEMGLRLKLRIRPPELNALPWELLYDPDQAEYVCLSRQTPIVRYLETPRLVRPLTVSPPLRVLGMVASPETLPALDIEREVQRVERATGTLQDRGLLELEWLAGQTWRHLQEAMWGGPWHIFHFIGHGGFDAQADEGFIALADRAGRRSDLSATRLSRLLADHAPLRLVLLNACEGARGGQREILSSTASILVHRGLPAVLAMQYEITDRAAIEFARAFYRALAFGMAVDEAVVAARKAIDLALTNTVEWGTPVLYMHTPDGVLFHLTGVPQAEAPPPAPMADAELERRLEQRYTAGLSAFWLEEWDVACGQFQAIVAERPDYQDAADRLAEARRQKKWGALYEQAQAARKAEDWETARSALEELVAEKPDYQDAAALLEATNRQVRLAGLYAQAQRLGQAEQWQAVVNVFAQIEALEPDYADPVRLLDTAKQELAEQARRAELDDFYSRAVREMDAGRWQEAQGLLRQVQAQDPGYLEVERLLARAESEIERQRQQQAEDQRRERIAALYREAQELAGAEQWQPALDKLGQIRDLDPQFSDPEGIDVRARTGLEREEEEAERRRELAALYADAVGLLRAKRFEEALDKWAEVQAIDAAYTDRKKVQTTARKKLAARDRPALWRRLPRRAWVALGAVALVAVLVAGGAALWPVITAMPTLTPTGTVETTDTPAVTPITTSTLVPAPMGGAPLPGLVPTNPVTGTVWEWSDGSAMVYVPAGAFWMGSTDEDIDAILAECSDCQRDWYADEQPPHEVNLDAFWIDRIEVTNAMFARFVADTGYETEAEKKGSSWTFNPASKEWEDTDGADWQHPYGPSTSLAGLDKHPVVHVTWNDAGAYCAWAGKRMPTEAEWGKAARGTDRRVYPWGDGFDGSLVNFCDINCELDWKNEDWDDGNVHTAPAGNYPDGASPYGALDMAGNVWEWVMDWYGEDYYANSPDRNPEGPDSGEWRVLRGGSWFIDQRLVRGADRNNLAEPSSPGFDVGFRCARSDSEPPQLVGTTAPTHTAPPTPTPTGTPRPPTNTPSPTSTPTRTPDPPLPGPMPANPSAGTVWEWSDDNAMVYVPTGAFWMGSEESDPDADDNEKPQHEVTLDAFWIDRTEVNNTMFARFVTDTGYETDAEKKGSSSAIYPSSKEWVDTDGADWQHPYGPSSGLDGLERRPVVHVSWNDAAAYCQWAGKRLPTEAEWEKAARGIDKRVYPWGSDFDGTLLNFCDVNCGYDHEAEEWDDGYTDAAPVGNYPDGASPYGALDMAGNVWEWTGSLGKPYPYNSEDGREDQEDGGARVVRGGSWYSEPDDVPAARRHIDEPSYSVNDVGFRCARSDMVYVPGGAFWMGSGEGDPDADNDERPQHEVTLDAFWIDRTEVTNAQYWRCMDDGACSPPSSFASETRDRYYGASEFDDYPVIWVNWEQADAYCTWAGKRLPTEAEWEKAARGTDRRLYPWGEGIDCDHADYGDCVEDTARVASYPQGASPYGALDMAGNVWEWVADWYSNDYYATSVDRSPQGPNSGWGRVLRGGSWRSEQSNVRTASRYNNGPSRSYLSVGFRCASSDSVP